jgi:hypothetical protein
MTDKTLRLTIYIIMAAVIVLALIFTPLQP